MNIITACNRGPTLYIMVLTGIHASSMHSTELHNLQNALRNVETYPVLGYTALGLSEQQTGFQLMSISVHAFCVRVLAVRKERGLYCKSSCSNGLNQGESQSKLAKEYGLAVCGWIHYWFYIFISVIQTELVQGPQYQNA